MPAAAAATDRDFGLRGDRRRFRLPHHVDDRRRLGVDDPETETFIELDGSVRPRRRERDGFPFASRAREKIADQPRADALAALLFK